MREYRRQPALVRAEIEAGIQEYEEAKREMLMERLASDRIARCGTLAVDAGVWFFRSLLYAVRGDLPDLADHRSVMPRNLMLH